MGFYTGANEILEIELDDVYLAIGCLTSNDFSEDVEQLDSTTRDNDGWKTYRLTNQSYQIPFSGLVINTKYAKGDFTKISYDRLQDLKRAKTIINWRTKTSDLQFIESGQGYIIELSKTSSSEDFISFSATILGQGKPITTTGKAYNVEDGKGSIVNDGKGNNIITA